MIPIPEINFASQGWQCPICKRVYSPSTAMCFNCPNNGTTVTTGSTTLTPTPGKKTITLKGVSKRKRAKDGVQNTQRYSFEITADLKQQLERAVLEHQLNTGKKVSTSAVIRTAIEKYLKAGRL